MSPWWRAQVWAGSFLKAELRTRERLAFRGLER